MQLHATPCNSMQLNRLLFDVFGMMMLFFVRFGQFDVNRLLFDVFGMIMLFFVRFGHNQLLKDISRQNPLQFVLNGSVPVFFCFFVREDGVLKRRIWVYLKRPPFWVYRFYVPLALDWTVVSILRGFPC